jgi:hypothetical protein
LSRIFSVPTASVRFLHVEFGLPPIQHLGDIALARFHCHLALAAPHTLHSIMHNSRRLQDPDPSPDSLEQCTRAALLRLNRPWIMITSCCLRASCALLQNSQSAPTLASCTRQPLIPGGRKSVFYLPYTAGITPMRAFSLRIFTDGTCFSQPYGYARLPRYPRRFLSFSFAPRPLLCCMQI